MEITIKCAGNNPVDINADNLGIATAGDVAESAVIRQIFGIGDDMVASVNGNIENNNFALEDGDVITLSTKGHKKGYTNPYTDGDIDECGNAERVYDDDAKASITISSGGNVVHFDLSDIGTGTAELMASALVKMTFGLGDDFVASVNGGEPTAANVPLYPGDEVSLSTKGHKKGISQG